MYTQFWSVTCLTEDRTSRREMSRKNQTCKLSYNTLRDRKTSRCSMTFLVNMSSWIYMPISDVAFRCLKL